MQQFLLLAKAVSLEVQSHTQILNLAVQLLSHQAVNLAVQSLHLRAEDFPAAADVIMLANQLNVITVRMENHPAFFLRILRRLK